MRVCPVMGVVPSDYWGRPMSWSLFLPVFETAKLRSGMVFWVGFWHVFPVPSCIAVCLFGGVLAWDGLKRKGICEGRVSGFGAALSRPFGKIVLSLYIDRAMMVEKRCGCACPSDFWVTSDNYQASWRSAWTWASFTRWGLTSSDAVFS
jgi:hypothetical protein